MSPIASVHAPMLDDLSDFDAPVATVVVAAPNAGESARDQVDIRVKDVTARLEADGAPPALVDAVTSTLRQTLDGAPSGMWVGIVADAAGVTVVPVVDVPAEVVSVGSLPRFVPFVHDRFEHRPHLVVRCDRTGADIARVYRDHRAERAVHGEEQHVQKVHQGGWSQARLQRHSEHTWDQNAQEIVDAVVRDAEAIDAALIVVTGDGRAVQLVEQHLPESWADRLVTDDTEPTDPEGDELVFERASTLVRDRAATELVQLLQRFAEGRGRGDLGTDDVDEVLSSLRRGAVDTLLVADDVDDEVFVAAADHREVARDRQLLTDAGFEDVFGARLTDAAVAAAVAGGAAVVVVPAHGPDSPKGPLGARLRY